MRAGWMGCCQRSSGDACNDGRCTPLFSKVLVNLGAYDIYLPNTDFGEKSSCRRVENPMAKAYIENHAKT